MSGERIADDEILYRRIPPSKDWFQPPDRITTANFKLGDGELGISVSRASIVSAAAVLSHPRAKPNSGLAEITAGQVRSARNGEGKPLNLDVVAVGDEEEHGHAEIRGPVPGEISQSAAKALKKLFTLTQRPQ